MKTALVTGGARGIGLAIAKKLKTNYRVIIWDIEQMNDEGRRTKDEKSHIYEQTTGFEFRKVDISNFEEVHQKAKEVGELDILINNAGITRDKLLLRMGEDDWDKVIKVNLKGTFNCTHAFLPAMIRKRWGRIINITSVIGIIGNKGQANYSASKAGIIGFTKSIAKEVGSRNITCNAIAPGYIITEMTEKLPTEVQEAYIKSIPLGRGGTPEEIAELVNFLCSEEASYLTGQVINIDGGMV